MKILWVAAYGGNYNSIGLSGTGGWIAPLETALTKQFPNLELGITFTHPTDYKCLEKGNISYFPILKKKYNNVTKLFKRILGIEQREEERIVKQMAIVAKNYKPDIIHIWGCENFYARIINYVDCPCVIHIQGLVSSIINVYCPPMVSIDDIAKSDGFINRRILFRGNLQRYRNFQQKVKSEKDIAKKCKYWIGRTEWDMQSVMSLNPKVMYCHCDELLREDFYSGKWKYHYDGKLTIQSNISANWYKGLDLILKTAKVLVDNNIKFQWNICGITANSEMVKMFENTIGIKSREVNVNYLGSHPAAYIKERLLSCDAYVHPSHIENSSNAIGEAMLLGVPVIAEFVGGNPTMLKNNSGIIVQPYDPYCLAYQITSITDKKKAEEISNNARLLARSRHNKENVVNDLVCAYKKILINEKSDNQ